MSEDASQSSEKTKNPKLPSADETIDSNSRSERRPIPVEPLTRGASIGRYVLLDQLGAGAMGVVYSAYDPELDRKLALKLLHPGASSREAKATRNRLRREAQALARLTHPNVVAVHDVGTHRGRVFVAMEFIAGKTLRQWVRSAPLTPHSVDAVIEVFAAAGQGLAAAHRAGLVHRDFKPENVLLGDDDLVRVVDFGLARRSAEEELGDESLDTSGTISVDDYYESIASTASRSLEISLTGTGRAMGTPAYMAPEQHLGEVATVRSDQFAFCVALWEALYGERPFPGRDLPSLTLSVTTGALRDPPTDGPHAHRVTSHIHRALVRGMSIDPDDRFTKIDDLLEALTHDPNRRRRRVGRLIALNLFGASLIFGAGIWVAGYFGPAPEQAVLCDPQVRLAEVWTEERQASIASRFTDLDAPFAEHSGREVERRLHAYAKQWAAAWGDTCETERTLGLGVELELQRECLDQRLRELGVFTDTLLGTSPSEFAARAEHAVAAAESLPQIPVCRDLARLHVDPERNAAEREAVSALEQRLSQAHSIGNLGEPTTGLKLALSVVDDARLLTSPRLLTRALLLVAHLEVSATEHDLALKRLLEAYTIAEHHGEDWLRAEAAIELMGLTGFHFQRASESKIWEQISSSLLQRIGDPPDLRGRWHEGVGGVRMRQTELEAAETALRQALELLEQVHGGNARELESVLQALGNVARERGDYERAVAFHTRLLTRRQAVYGPDHPTVASIHGALGSDAYFRADYKLARDHYEQALRIVAECYGKQSPAYQHKLSNYAAVLERLGELEQAETIYRTLVATNIERYGEGDIRIATSLENLGLVLLSAYELEEATSLFRRSLALCTEHYGDDHARTGSSKLNLGFALYSQGEFGPARELYDQTLVTWRDKLGDEHPDLGLVYGNIAELDLEEGHLEDARLHFEHTLELTEAGLGLESPELGYPLTGLARVALAKDRVDTAIGLAERGLLLREETWLPAGDRGTTQLVLSRALRARGRAEDRSRARDLALLAREDIRRSGNEARLAEVLAWLESLD